MKKNILPILLFLMFIPLYVNAETCDIDKITIDNITIENKSNNVEEIEEATASGKKINLNLSMSEVGDNIEYKFEVKNDSNEDYELNKTSLNLNSDYINYSFETEDDSNVVKAKSSKYVTLRVEYKTEVPEDKFESGMYTDNKTMIVHLSNGNTINVPDTFKNPNTRVQSYILVILILLLISGSLYVLLKKKKYSKFMTLIIGTAIIIPISAYALCKCEINIQSNVRIDKREKYNIYLTNAFGSNTKENLQTFIDKYDMKHYKINEDIAFSYEGQDYHYYGEDDTNNEGPVLKLVSGYTGETFNIEDFVLSYWNYIDGIEEWKLSEANLWHGYSDENDMDSYLEELVSMGFEVTYRNRGNYRLKFPATITMPNHDIYLTINDG